MISLNPILAAAQPASTAPTSGTTPVKSKSPNDLGPNAFITLLTAQLQAQNPLNPMDPNQMVSELTSMNTLQEIIQIRQDMDTLTTSPAPAPTGGSGSPTAPVSSAASPASSNTAAAGPAAAAKAFSAGLAALTNSLAPASSATLYPQFKSKSQLF